MSRRTLVLAVIFLLCLVGLGVDFFCSSHNKVAAAQTDAPAYASNGDLLAPFNYREWIYLTSGIDMSYAPKAMDMDGHSIFDNVFVNPAAYKSFLGSGTWPDKTVLVLEVREARTKGSINQTGHFQGTGVSAIEVHVKDEARFPGKWAFFSFDSPAANGTLIPQGAPCYSCHLAHAAVDTTFVQFYPTLLPIAQKKGTLSQTFVKEEAASGGGK
jgi:cytochrome P460